MTGPFMSLLSILVFLTYSCPTTSYQIKNIEKLKNTTCEAVYERALGSRKELDFTKAIGNLSCSPGPNGFIRYHCMAIEDGHDIQFCAEWIWIESDQCPRLLSLQGIINPKECGGEGCPADEYQSHMYYKYPACFVKEQRKKETATHNTQSPKIESSHPTVVVKVLLTLIIATVLAAGIAIYVVRRRRRNGKTYTDSEQQRLPSKTYTDSGQQRLRSKTYTDSEQQRLPMRPIPLSEAKRCLQNGKCILLTGKKGEGVSTFIEKIHRTHFHDHKYMVMDYGFHDIDYTKKLFLVISERSMIDKREKEALQNLINMNERQTKIVIDVPRSSYESLKERLHAGCSEVVIGIDLSSDEWKMNEDERKELIGQMMGEKKIDDTQLPESQKSQIVDYESEHYGFCYICGRLFDGTREELIAKLTNVQKSLKEIEEGILSSASTKSNSVKELEMDPLL